MTRPRSSTVTSSHDVEHQAQIVVDEEDGGPVVGQAPQAAAQGLAAGGIESGRGLVEEEHARTSGDGSGQRHQPALGVRQLGGEEVDGRAQRPQVGGPTGTAPGPLRRHQQVLADGQVLEQLQRLEGAAHAEAGPGVHRQPLDGPAVERDAARTTPGRSR